MLRGRVEVDGRELPVEVTRASRTALRVTFTERPPSDEAIFDRLVLDLGDREAVLSTCRFQTTGAGVAEGRLVFVSDVYDMNALLFDREVVSVSDAYSALPLVLSKKELVRQEFRAFVADAMHDFAVWRAFFDDQDRMLADEPPDVAEAAREAILATQGREFLAFFAAHAEQLAGHVRGFTKEEHERHGSYFRRNAWPYITMSAILHRTNTKPFGYAGDAEMMRLLYENRPVGASLFERLMHLYPARVAAAEAVRNRLRLIPQALHEVASRFPALPPHGFRFLSVAAGPACELDGIFRSAADAGRMHGTLLDQDPHAHAAARDNVNRIARELGVPVEVTYLDESVRTMLRTRVAERLGRYHFIYSMGLFDYLASPVARAVIGKMYELLVPGGALLIGNYHVANPSRYYMDYWADWPLIYRSEAAFLELAGGLDGAETSLTFDPSGSQMFLRADRSR